MAGQEGQQAQASDDGAQQQAQQVANAVDISNVQEGTAEDLGSNDTVVVLASDFQS